MSDASIAHTLAEGRALTRALRPCTGQNFRQLVLLPPPTNGNDSRIRPRPQMIRTAQFVRGEPVNTIPNHDPWQDSHSRLKSQHRFQKVGISS